MAVIDILQHYDAKKKAAHAAKTVKHGVSAYFIIHYCVCHVFHWYASNIGNVMGTFPLHDPRNFFRSTGTSGLFPLKNLGLILIPLPKFQGHVNLE